MTGFQIEKGEDPKVAHERLFPLKPRKHRRIEIVSPVCLRGHREDGCGQLSLTVHINLFYKER